MRLFLVGPRHGTYRSNFPEYKRTAAYWRQLGHTVVSPAELDIPEGADPVVGWEHLSVPPEIIEEHFRRDVAELTASDAVILMDGWEEDESASVLADVAEIAGMAAFEQTGEGNSYQELGDDSEQESDPFLAIIAELVELHRTKRHDYAHEGDTLANYRRAERSGIPMWVAIHLRVAEKFERLENIVRGRITQMNHDSPDESIKDIALGSILALQAYREQEEK